MQRIYIQERPLWREQAREFGFHYHTMYGEPYWCEDYYYEFSLKEIETLEDATNELHEMAVEAVAKVVNSEELLRKFAIPEVVWNFVQDSWKAQELSLYGRFDFAYDGKHPPKMLEYNADTPTSLYESALFQWLWLEEQVEARRLPQHSDQFNSIQEKIIERFTMMKSWYGIDHFYFSGCEASAEDRGTLQYLQDCAVDAGLDNSFIDIAQLGLSDDGSFTDSNDQVIAAIFKLYPWEYMFREEFAAYLDHRKTHWLEPAWKSIISNKAILPLLWSLFPNHPNLLAAYFEGDAGVNTLSSYVRKPLFSREGANITIMDRGRILCEAEGPYGEEGAIIQEYYPLPVFQGNYTLIGSWVVGNESAGICIREDRDMITQDLSRFYPHIILN